MTTLFPIDPAKVANYPVTLSPELLEGNAEQHAVLQCMCDSPFIIFLTLTEVLMLDNHKPDLPSGPSETRITPSPSPGINRYNLAIRANDNRSTYLYSGTQQPSESYALIYDSVKQSFTLDRVSNDFTFNLRSTPTVKSSKALADTYPHLDTGVSDPESSSDDFEDNDLDCSGADPNNPYDYRHFLNQRRTPSPVIPDLPTSAPGSPPYHAAPFPKPGPVPNRASPRRTPSPTSREEADADNEESDDGGLTIEFDPDIKKPPRLQGKFSHNGPISLRSAASSVSPAAMVQESSESDEDEDVEEMQLETNGVEILQENEDDGEDEDEDDEDEDEDEDDEDDHEDDHEDDGEPGNEGELEDDDDGSLAAELEQAMESQADEEVNGTMHGIENGVGTALGLGIAGAGPGVRRNHIPDDSSSESEEE